METVELYRGISKEEFAVWEKKEYQKLKNVIWFTSSLEDAKLYAKYAIVKICVILNEACKTHYENGARGCLDDYKGYGIHYNGKFYSFEKLYILENVESLELSREITPEFINNPDYSELRDKKQVFVTTHTLDLIKLEKSHVSSEVIDGSELIQKIPKDARCASIKEDSVNIYRLTP